MYFTYKMKTLLLIRHAKSSWDVPGQNDFERTLNARGLKDAPVMAKRLTERNLQIDLFLSSPAKRAKKTCELFMQELGVDEKTIVLKPELYLAESPVFYNVIKQIDASISHTAVFSHNNGITDFVNQLTKVRVDNMPTCSIFAVKVHSNKWSDFETAEKEFLFFDYPKRLL